MSKRSILGLASTLFVASFFLTAVGRVYGGLGPSILGYESAIITLVDPWQPEGLKSLREETVLFVSIVFSGWINPIFLITVSLLVRRSTENIGRKLRAILLFMLPSCWIVFYEDHARPGLGYFVWTASMIIALFSSWLSRATVIQEPHLPIRSPSAN